MKTEKFSVVGQRVNRVEGYEKVTGESRYVADIVLPGMLSGRILRSPYPHAKILRIDASKAEKLRGVRAVVTAEDTIKQGWGAFFPDQYPLSVGKARYVGEEVAAVAAIDPSIAEEAMELIEVEWEELPDHLPGRPASGRRHQVDVMHPCLLAGKDKKPSGIPEGFLLSLSTPQA